MILKMQELDKISTTKQRLFKKKTGMNERKMAKSTQYLLGLKTLEKKFTKDEHLSLFSEENNKEKKVKKWVKQKNKI